MMALRSIETHCVTLRNLALFRPKLRNSSSTNQIDDYAKDGGEELSTKNALRSNYEYLTIL